MKNSTIAINKYNQHHLGQKWRDRRLARGLSLVALADKLGVSHSVPSKWELGGLPAASNLAPLAEVLGYATIGELLADPATPAKAPAIAKPVQSGLWGDWKAAKPAPVLESLPQPPEPEAKKPPAGFDDLKVPHDGTISATIDLFIHVWGDNGSVWINLDNGLPPVSLTTDQARKLGRRILVAMDEAKR